MQASRLWGVCALWESTTPVTRQRDSTAPLVATSHACPRHTHVNVIFSVSSWAFALKAAASDDTEFR